MVVAFAGRRAQSIDGDLEPVSLRIRRLLTALQPTAVVGALADGGDMLIVEAAVRIPAGPAVHLQLPTPEDVFRVKSVEPAWQPRFDRTIEEVRKRGSVESLGLEDGSEAYRRVNAAILDRAIELAGEDERTVVLVVAGQGEGEMVEDLIAGGELRNLPTLRIDPHVTVTDQPRVFVAMPYGKKPDPQRRIDVDCDLVYEKILVPALEDAQLYYRRADEEIDSGVILQPMVEWLADADLVIGDLQTGNFNVGWELGLRHLMRGQTLLIRPAGTSSPFDLNMVRQVQYRHDAGGVSDDAAIEAWSALAPYLRGVPDGGGRSDSPVDAVMKVVQWGRLERRSEADAHFDALRQELSAARDLRDGDFMLEVIADAKGLSGEAVQLLRAEAGVGLVRIGRYADARELLRDIVECDSRVLRPEAHVYYAQALYRPVGADIEAYDAAETILRRVLIKRPSHPEVRAMLGAIAKRRLRLRSTAAEREPDLHLAMDSYRHDYETNLNAYYEGINVVALGVVLYLQYGDDDGGALARDLLPAVRLAASLAQRLDPRDYWATATAAECALYELLMGAENADVAGAYRAAGAMRPGAGDVDSTLFQLDFLDMLGLPKGPLATAREALLAGAGRASTNAG